MAHIRQPRPDSGLGFQVESLQTFSGVASSLGSKSALFATRVPEHLTAGVPLRSGAVRGGWKSESGDQHERTWHI